MEVTLPPVREVKTLKRWQPEPNVYCSSYAQLIDNLAKNTYLNPINYCLCRSGVWYSLQRGGKNKWLHHKGISYEKPTGVPHEFCPEMQRAFVEYYNKTLKPSETPVLFMDAVNPTPSTKLSYGWIDFNQVTMRR